MKKKVLFISSSAPYDTVDHAGGKVHNRYVKKMHQSNRFDIFLISLCWADEKEKIDLDEYGIKNSIYALDRNFFHKILRKLISGISFFNPFDRYCNLLLSYERYQLKRMIRAYRRRQGMPDIIICQWTQTILLYPFLQKIFSNVDIVAIEEDVTFLNYMRQASYAQTKIKKMIKEYQSEKMRKLEFKYLSESKIAVINNIKDMKLLEDYGYKKNNLFLSTVYFDDYSYIKRKINNKDVLYYGAMWRKENSESALWFIKNVFHLIEDQEVRFVIIGSRPSSELLQSANDRIIVTGFVEDVSSYFSTAMCLAAPLVLGAGIKVKILEAMSAGVPVLTNDIGIEGIPASDGKEYFNCKTAIDYANIINKLAARSINVKDMEILSKKMVHTQFNIDSKIEEFVERIS